jgi:hypothetical protein
VQGFFLDLGLNALGVAIGFHPVYDYFHSRRTELYYALGSLHVLLLPVVVILVFTGHAKSAGLMFQQRRDIHERSFVWSSVLAVCAGFIVPGVIGLGLDARINQAFYFAVIFAPPVLVMFVLPALAILLERWRISFPLPNPFASLGGVVLFSASVWAYEAMIELTLFLVRARGGVMANELIMLMGVGSYLAVRMFLFYTVAVYRAEIVGIVLTTFHLTIRLLATLPND